MTTTSSCPHGFTREDLERILGSQIEEFWQWMTGQTCSICDGRRYDHDEQVYKATECAGNPHGVVVYGHDLERFLRGLPVIDW